MLLKKCTKPFCGKIYNENDEAFHDGYCDCGFELIDYDPAEEMAKEGGAQEEVASTGEAPATEEVEVSAEEVTEDIFSFQENKDTSVFTDVEGTQEELGSSRLEDSAEGAGETESLSEDTDFQPGDGDVSQQSVLHTYKDEDNTETLLSSANSSEDTEQASHVISSKDAEIIEGPPYLILEDGTLVFPEDEEYAETLRQRQEQEELLQVDPYENYNGNRLVAMIDGEVYRTFPLEYDENIIGRESKGQKADIDLTEIDPERKISRRHALIYRYNKQFYVRNLSGKNALFVNREPIAQNGEVVLEDGSTIVLSGVYGLIFYAASEAESNE